MGPTAAGRSNIADAVRWVLGEQNSRNLRGVKMEDVIFGGTQTRRAKAYCEVSLYFDNVDHKIDAAYSEIVVTRKMFRSGESEYLLNRTPVRLKDILDIVRDTGIGREGYSIVGQGKIDELLSAKPGARRKAFEEAAGVMKFRTRKEEAEGKLQRTRKTSSALATFWRNCKRSFPHSAHRRKRREPTSGCLNGRSFWKPTCSSSITNACRRALPS